MTTTVEIKWINYIKNARKQTPFRLDETPFVLRPSIQSFTMCWLHAVWLQWGPDWGACCWYSSHETAIIIFKYCKRRGQTLHSDSPYTSHEAHNGAAKSVRERVSFSTEEQAHPRTLPLQFTETAGRLGKKERYFAINYIDLNCVEEAVIGLELCLVST